MANTTDRYRVPTTDANVRLEERVRQLERQVADLHAARGLRRSTMSGGAVRVTDGGDEVARIGVGGYSGYAGERLNRRSVRIQAAGGGLMFLATAEDGLVWPPVQAPFGRVNDGIAVTSGSFATYWQSYLVLTAGTVNTVATCTADAATTGEVRLTVGGTGLASAPRAIAAGDQTDVVFAWDLAGLGVTLGTGLFLNVQVRRTSGAGNVNTYLPRPAQMSDRVVFGGTADGIPYVDDAS